jgi:branched-chain amino acid transport system substrate-binding protein
MGDTMKQASARERTHRKRSTLIALGLVSGLLVAACGSDDDSSTPASGAPSATDAPAATDAPVATDAPDAGTTPPLETAAPGTIPAELTMGQGVTDTEIKIGIIIDDSGPFAAFSPALRATIDAKVSTINDGGGIAGRQMKIIYYDSKDDVAQDLILTKRLWEQDKVLMIYHLDLNGPPLDYVTENKIPVFTFAGGPAVFSSKYPYVAPVGGSTTSWNAQSAYAVVHYQDKHPKHVAVSIFAFEEPLKFWIEDVWKKLGAETVTIDIGVDPTSDCSALVLKNQSADVDFWDFHDNSWLACIPAELNAGWSPEFGQGGPSTSEVSTASLIGKPMADLQVLAGAPTTLANGLPVHATIPPENQEYIDAMKKYAPEYSSDRWLNDPIQLPSGWLTMTLMETMLTETAKTGELSPEALDTWMLQAKNIPAFASDPIPSLAGDCKTGTDSTIWGTWQWDDAKSELYMVPFAPLAGEKLINNDWYDDDPCYITKLADKYYVS